MDQDGQRPVTPTGRRKPVRYSAALGKRICERVARGELIYRLAREPGMPTAEGMAKWARERPDFAASLEAARRCGGRPAGQRGPVSTYCPETAQAIFERLCEGESLTAIGRDPTMPSISTIFYWRRRIAAFDELVACGKQIQAERFCDMGWELACEATPETAYLTHVRLAQLRWTAGVMAPRKFRLKAVEPEKEPRRIDLLMRRFEVEDDPETGEMIVVAYCPDPETGEVVREPEKPGSRWTPPEGHVRPARWRPKGEV